MTSSVPELAPLPLRAPDSTSQKQLVVRRSTGGPNSHSVAPSFAPTPCAALCQTTRKKNYVLVHFLPLYPRSYLRFAPLSEALFFNEDKSNAMRARKKRNVYLPLGRILRCSSSSSLKNTHA